jgi:3'-5' exonuclease
MICVFDCETIPDATLIRHTLGIEGNDLEISKKAIELQEQKSGSGFLPHPYHQVVSIAAVIADEYGYFKKVGSFPRDVPSPHEKELLESFLGYLDTHQPKLISFNGRGFDLPMLFLRAMKYNLTCPAYFETDNPQHGKSKWENYRQRYSERFHVDLLDSLGHFGAVRTLKLDVVCSMVGLPGKYDVSGDQVMDLYYTGEQTKICEYCESDVLNTYWLYLKYELLKGNLSLTEYGDIVHAFSQQIPAGKSYSEVFVESAKAEIKTLQ